MNATECFAPAAGVRKYEFWNEPDLSAQCITYYSWMEFYTLQSQAIQNSYADANADVVAGRTPCPVASCPFQPIIIASAFAQSETGPSSGLPTPDVAAATTYCTGAANVTGACSPYAATYPADFYAYMGALSVRNEHTVFPPWLPSGLLAGVSNSSLQNMNAFSIHSCAPLTAGLPHASLRPCRRPSTCSPPPQTARLVSSCTARPAAAWPTSPPRAPRL